MNIKTTHTVNGMEGIKQAIPHVARTIGSVNNYNRVIRIGSAIVILPDTDRTKEATLPEVLKAMGIKMQNAQEEKLYKYAITDCTGDYEGIWGLTEDQNRLMKAIIDQGYLLDDDTRFKPLDDNDIKRI